MLAIKYQELYLIADSKNAKVCYENYCEIILNNKKGKEVGRAKIDRDQIVNACRYTWHLNSTGYAECTRKGKMHRVLFDVAPAAEVDHINGDRLDNRKENLRLVTRAQNTCNRGNNRNNTTGLRGVYWHKTEKKWHAAIGTNGKRKHLGRFNNREDAHAARLKAEKKYFGEYGRAC